MGQLGRRRAHARAVKCFSRAIEGDDPEDVRFDLTPRVVEGLSDIAYTSAGHIDCVVTRRGKVRCGDAAQAGSMQTIEGVADAKAVFVDYSLACAETRGGKLYCWEPDSGERAQLVPRAPTVGG